MKNITICPDCENEFETQSQSNDPPVLTLEQVCSDCGIEVEPKLIQYPGPHQVAIGPALEEEVCVECESDATIRKQKTGEPMVGLCEECKEVFLELE